MTNEKMMDDLMSLFRDDENGAGLNESDIREIVRAAIVERLSQVDLMIFAYNQPDDVDERRRLCGLLYEEYARREEKADDWVRP